MRVKPRWVVRGLWFTMACAGLACDAPARAPRSDGPDSGAGSSQPSGSSGGTHAEPPQDAGRTTPDASLQVLPPLPALSVCALHVGAECDGPEDCADGESCCGQFDRATYSYSSIACRASCAPPDQFELCHPGQACAVAGQVCRRSVLIPHAFVTVCADPAAVPDDTTSERVAGKIACGDSQCDVGTEQCCLRASFDFSVMMSEALPPYCSNVGAPCGCTTRPDADAGVVRDGG